MAERDADEAAEQARLEQERAEIAKAALDEATWRRAAEAEEAARQRAWKAEQLQRQYQRLRERREAVARRNREEGRKRSRQVTSYVADKIWAGKITASQAEEAAAELAPEIHQEKPLPDINKSLSHVDGR